jgi:hypothetical protein
MCPGCREGQLGEVLTLASRDVGDVESTWRQFVPSASLQRVDPRTFAFSWTSAATPGFSVVKYRLNASVQSAIEPDGQLMACRVASRGGWVGTPRGDLNAGLPWLSLDGPTSARWHTRADVRAFVFDRAVAEGRHAVWPATTASGCALPRPAPPRSAGISPRTGSACSSMSPDRSSCRDSVLR